MLYKFQNLRKRLDDLGFPTIDGGTPYKAIREDFESAYKKGSVTFEPDGIMLDHNGKKYKGYMYIREAYVTFNGGPEKFPKFHLVKCSVIQEFIDKGKFDQRYEWSNHQMNDITDKQTKKIYNDKVLNLCSKCRRAIEDSIETTDDFYQTLDIRAREETTLEIDIFGYTRDWPSVSRAYRKKVGYTCESCSLHIENKFDQRYLHTHHKNGDKTINDEANLECLCVLCHSYKDATHEKNFEKKRMKSELMVFVNKYRSQLLEVKNPFLYQMPAIDRTSKISLGKV
jgi:5-methylcytosine-specific restriction endonuclease McrA